MPVITITADYSWIAVLIWDVTYEKRSGVDYRLSMGYYVDIEERYRSVARFSLADLPAGVTVTQVRRRINCVSAGGSGHQLDDHAYGSNGQENPELDDAPTLYYRCASGNLYSDDSTDLRTTGVKWRTLGGNVCQDIMNAKAAVNRFSLAWHEEGDNDAYATIDSHARGSYPPQLEITYEEAAPPVAYRYSDGLVCIQT